MLRAEKSGHTNLQRPKIKLLGWAVPTVYTIRTSIITECMLLKTLLVAISGLQLRLYSRIPGQPKTEKEKT